MMKAWYFLSCMFFTLITIETTGGPVTSRSCKKNSQCGTFGYLCGQNDTCQCGPFYVLNSYGDKCVGGIGQKCRYDEHCIEGAFCEIQMSCQCKDDLYPSEDRFSCSKSPSIASLEPHLFTTGILLYQCLKII
ncbi:hypothetical protein Zmor_011716 [Zophobas morio]|uniref:EB domain-containing protein n=1 Tax=Zophobas morio TaxID=2755281 RepID=A0AA38IRJ8_9CUCU|nr:hypothetical protein Zmor_011716 [Zophobas morio]